MIMKIRFLLICLFTVVLIPYLTAYTHSPLQVTASPFSGYDDPLRFDPQDKSFNAFYGPINSMIIHAGKSLAFHFAHNDHQYFLILFFTFIFIPLLIALLLSFKIYSSLARYNNIKKETQYRFIINNLWICLSIILFTYLFLRRHIFSNEVFFFPLLLLIFYLLIKDNFRLRQYFYATFPVILISIGLNLGYILFLAVLMLGYLFYIYKHNFALLKKNLIKIMILSVIYFVVLCLLYYFGFDFYRFIENMLSSLNNIAPFSIGYFLPIFVCIYLLRVFKPYKQTDIYAFLFFISLLLIIIFFLASIITLTYGTLLYKRFPVILAPYIYIIVFLFFNNKKNSYLFPVLFIYVFMLCGDYSNNIIFGITRKIEQTVPIIFKGSSKIVNKRLSNIKVLQSLEKQLEQELTKQKFLTQYDHIYYFPYIMGTVDSFIPRINNTYLIRYPEVNLFAPPQKVIYVLSFTRAYKIIARKDKLCGKKIDNNNTAYVSPLFKRVSTYLRLIPNRSLQKGYNDHGYLLMESIKCKKSRIFDR
jgi:hypothetical protein